MCLCVCIRAQPLWENIQKLEALKNDEFWERNAISHLRNSYQGQYSAIHSGSRAAPIIGVDELLGEAIKNFYAAGICNVTPLVECHFEWPLCSHLTT